MISKADLERWEDNYKKGETDGLWVEDYEELFRSIPKLIEAVRTLTKGLSIIADISIQSSCVSRVKYSLDAIYKSDDPLPPRQNTYGGPY